jgi:hypothetical protein
MIAVARFRLEALGTRIRFALAQLLSKGVAKAVLENARAYREAFADKGGGALTSFRSCTRSGNCSHPVDHTLFSGEIVCPMLAFRDLRIAPPARHVAGRAVGVGIEAKVYRALGWDHHLRQ